MIELCTYVYKFQKRYSWVLSSLVQQTFKNFTVTTDIYDQDPFKNLTDDIKRIYSPHLTMKFNEYNQQQIQYRGYTRTQNIKNTTAEWILFLDADDVFHPTFFEQLDSKLKTLSDSDKQKLISIPRFTMGVDDGYKLVNSVSYNDIISDAFNRCFVVKSKKLSNFGHVAGAGYFQLIHMPSLRAKGINSYVDGNYDNPMLNTSIKSKMRSDVVFRQKVGGKVAIKDLPPIIHIQHRRRCRDKEFDFNICQ